VSGVLERVPDERPARARAPHARSRALPRRARRARRAQGLDRARRRAQRRAARRRQRRAHERSEGAAAAFTQRLEPASIAKLLTAAAAYRGGLDPDAAISRMTCTGVERYGGQPLWCAYPSGPLAGLDDALAKSCNVAFANLGVELGVVAMAAEYRLWGFDADPGSLLGAAGRVHTIARTPRQLADLAIGLELVDVTPLHAALLAAIVAGDGRLPEPRVLDGACGPLGLADAPKAATEARDVLDPAVARRLRLAMAAGRAARHRRRPRAPRLRDRDEDRHGGRARTRLPRQLRRDRAARRDDARVLRSRDARSELARRHHGGARGDSAAARDARRASGAGASPPILSRRTSRPGHGRPAGIQPRSLTHPQPVQRLDIL
jgi:hypothetical protein